MPISSAICYWCRRARRAAAQRKQFAVARINRLNFAYAPVHLSMDRSIDHESQPATLHPIFVCGVQLTVLFVFIAPHQIWNSVSERFDCFSTVSSELSHTHTHTLTHSLIPEQSFKNTVNASIRCRKIEFERRFVSSSSDCFWICSQTELGRSVFHSNGESVVARRPRTQAPYPWKGSPIRNR